MKTKKKTNTRLRWFYVWLYNKTDRRDDEPRKVKAKSLAEALALIDGSSEMSRFSRSHVTDDLKEFRKWYDWNWGISEL